MAGERKDLRTKKTMARGSEEEDANSSFIGQMELTQQPEPVFYKDEGGQKWYYLFVFFVIRGEQTLQLKQAYDRAADGRRRIPINCTLLYDGTLEPVADQSILSLLGSSREDGEVSDGTPEFDVSKGTGSVRYRINKVSLRKDNQGFRLKLQLKGLEHLVQPVVTEATQVFSKRKRLRKEHRDPEQHQRGKVEILARRRNEEVERKLSRQSMQSTPLIHRVLSDPSFIKVPDYPEMRHAAEEKEQMFQDLDYQPKRAKRSRIGDGNGLMPTVDEDESYSPSQSHAGAQDENSQLRKRVAELEAKVAEIDQKFNDFLGLMHTAIPSYNPDAEVEADGANGSGNTSRLGEEDANTRPVQQSPSLMIQAAPSYPLQAGFLSLLKSFSAASNGSYRGIHHGSGTSQDVGSSLGPPMPPHDAGIGGGESLATGSSLQPTVSMGGKRGKRGPRRG